MRRFLIAAIAVLFCTASLPADEPHIYSINVDVLLSSDGSALVTENWDVTVADGTEWYLVRNNLGQASITDLHVWDENGMFETLPYWNIDASMHQKARRCGIHPTDDGCEICWGVGSYGDHSYKVRYRIMNAIDILTDADVFHFQLVSPGLSSTPDYVQTRIRTGNSPIDSSQVQYWGFGFDGSTGIEDGAIVFRSVNSRYTSLSSVIALVHFRSGTFSSGAIRDTDFQSVLDRAFDGADFGSTEDDSIIDFLIAILSMFCMIMVFLIVVGKVSARRKRKLLGCRPKDVAWFRDIPCRGNLCASRFILRRLGEPVTDACLCSAMMLRMIYKGVIHVMKNGSGNPDFAISPNADTSYMGNHEMQFLSFLRAASGDDSILQKKEFSKWAKKNSEALYLWSQDIDNEGEDTLNGMGIEMYTPVGQKCARDVLGLKRFLNDFTRMKEKQSLEAVLWQDYLVYAAMFGIADKVSKEMKDINPDLYAKNIETDNDITFIEIYTLSRLFSRHMADGIVRGNPNVSENSSSWGGHGGHSSFGGGGGFHGGGFGGGSR